MTTYRSSLQNESLDVTTTEVIATENAVFEVEFISLLDHLDVRNPMSVDEYLHPQEENNAHIFLSDAEILEVAMIIDDDFDVQENGDSTPMVRSKRSKAESIAILSAAMAVLDDEAEMWNDDLEKGIQVLRRIQREAGTRSKVGEGA